MLDLIDAMTRMTDLLGEHRAAVHALSLPPSDAALGRIQRTNLKVAKCFPKAVAVAENRLRKREKSYAQSEDITLGRAVKAIQMYQDTGKTPYPGSRIEKHLVAQAAEILTASQTATRILGRIIDYNAHWVFLVIRLVAAAQRFQQIPACQDIARLLARKVIDDRAAYFFAGQLLGGNVSVSDQFYHVTAEHVRKAHTGVGAAALFYAEYQSALDVFRFASPMYQNNPQAVRVLCDTIDMIFRLIADDLVEFRTRCSKPPGLTELVTRHLPSR